MNKTFNLLFFLKKSKIKANGTVPIYLRITIDGKPKEISSKRNIFPEQWDNKLQRLSGRSPEAKAMNDYLKTFEQEIYEAHHQAMKDKTPVTSSLLKAKVTGTEQNRRMLIPIFQEHNRRMQTLVPDEYAQGTVDRYETSLSHTQDFLNWKFSTSDIDISEIDFAFITDYEFYLRSEKGNANNTAVKYIKNFQKIINICLKNEWLNKDPFVKYETKLKEVERDYLSQIELQTIYNKNFVTPRLALVRDIFVFSCFTGLAYIDVKQLTNDNISIGIDGSKWIFTKREKTEGPSNIPILPIAQEMIKKYAEHPKCLNENRVLPILSNQRMNSYLKEIADVCGITKELTFHVARHTFATTVTLTNGVPMESVSKMLGHKSIKTTQHYAKILDKKVSDDMQMLKYKLQDMMAVDSNTKLITSTGS